MVRVLRPCRDGNGFSRQTRSDWWLLGPNAAERLIARGHCAGARRLLVKGYPAFPWAMLWVSDFQGMPPPRDLRTQGWKVAVATAEAWSASILCLAWRHGGRGHSLSTALWTVKRVQSNSGRTSLRCLRILIGALGGHLVYPLGLSRSVPPCRDPVCVSGGISYSFGRFLVAETLADRVFTGLGTLCAVGLANAPTGLAMQYYWVLQALRAFWAKLPSVKSKLREAVECWLR